MIETKTVLVLGAGASAPYKFATGKKLVRQIRDFAGSPKAEEWLRACDLWVTRYHAADRTALLPNVANLMQSLSLELKWSDPDSIDQFLELRQDMAEAAILIISILLLGAERRSEKRLWNDATKGHWYRYLKEKLRNPPEQLGKDQLRIISFNYDRSLELYLFRSLKPFYAATLKDEVYADAVRQLQFLHAYGSLGPLPLPWQSDAGTVPYGTEDYGEVLTAAKSIKVMHQGGEDPVQQNLATAQEWLEWADTILFLGFGFHVDNVKRLDFGNTLRKFVRRQIAATCLHLDLTSRDRVEWGLQADTHSNHTPVIRFAPPDADCYTFLHDHVVLS